MAQAAMRVLLVLRVACSSLSLPCQLQTRHRHKPHRTRQTLPVPFKIRTLALLVPVQTSL